MAVNLRQLALQTSIFLPSNFMINLGRRPGGSLTFAFLMEIIRVAPAPVGVDNDNQAPLKLTHGALTGIIQN
jgi:hypothetical protein